MEMFCSKHCCGCFVCLEQARFRIVQNAWSRCQRWSLRENFSHSVFLEFNCTLLRCPNRGKQLDAHIQLFIQIDQTWQAWNRIRRFKSTIPGCGRWNYYVPLLCVDVRESRSYIALITRYFKFRFRKYWAVSKCLQSSLARKNPNRRLRSLGPS